MGVLQQAIVMGQRQALKVDKLVSCAHGGVAAYVRA